MSGIYLLLRGGVASLAFHSFSPASRRILHAHLATGSPLYSTGGLVLSTLVPDLTRSAGTATTDPCPFCFRRGFLGDFIHAAHSSRLSFGFPRFCCFPDSVARNFALPRIAVCFPAPRFRPRSSFFYTHSGFLHDHSAGRAFSTRIELPRAISREFFFIDARRSDRRAFNAARKIENQFWRVIDIFLGTRY